MKLLRVKIGKRNFIINFLAVGFSALAFSASLTASIPLLLEIFLIKDFTSIVIDISTLVSSCISLAC